MTKPKGKKRKIDDPAKRKKKMDDPAKRKYEPVER